MRHTGIPTSYIWWKGLTRLSLSKAFVTSYVCINTRLNIFLLVILVTRILWCIKATSLIWLILLLMCVGNDNLHLLTSGIRQRLRIDLGDFAGNISYAEYDNFTVGSLHSKYRLDSLGTYSGNAGLRPWTSVIVYTVWHSIIVIYLVIYLV